MATRGLLYRDTDTGIHLNTSKRPVLFTLPRAATTPTFSLLPTQPRSSPCLAPCHPTLFHSLSRSLRLFARLSLFSPPLSLSLIIWRRFRILENGRMAEEEREGGGKNGWKVARRWIVQGWIILLWGDSCQAWILCIDDDFVFLCREPRFVSKRNGHFSRMVETDRCSWTLKRDGFEYFFLGKGRMVTISVQQW